MLQFNYKAKDKDGKTLTGVVESLNPASAAKTLQEHGLLVISVYEKRSLSLNSLQSFLPGSKRVSGQEIATFTRLVSTMLKAGLPLIDALSNLVLQIRNTYFREVVRSILQDVQGGTSLSVAMKRYPNVFNNLYVSLVASGEASGKLDETMERLAEMLEADLDFKGKIKGAMIYPAIVVVAMSAVAVFMITTIIPKIAEVYEDFGAELPLPTRILIGISDVIRNYTIFVVIGLVLLYIGYRIFRKNPASDLLINNFFLAIPIIGQLNSEVELTIMTRTLGTLINSGVSILDALRIVSTAMDNNKYRLGLEIATQTVEKGLPFSSAIRRNPDFAPIVSQLCAIGEETGTLGGSLNRLAKYYQESSERKVKGLTTALEPLMILIMGGMVGALAVAVLLPMFNLVNVIK